MALTCSWQSSQVSMSILKTCLSLFAHVIDWRFSFTVLSPLFDVAMGFAFFSWGIVILNWLFGMANLF
jgi:hypothetical protein